LVTEGGVKGSSSSGTSTGQERIDRLEQLKANRATSRYLPGMTGGILRFVGLIDVLSGILLGGGTKMSPTDEKTREELKEVDIIEEFKKANAKDKKRREELEEELSKLKEKVVELTDKTGIPDVIKGFYNLATAGGDLNKETDALTLITSGLSKSTELTTEELEKLKKSIPMPFQTAFNWLFSFSSGIKDAIIEVANFTSALNKATKYPTTSLGGGVYRSVTDTGRPLTIDLGQIRQDQGSSNPAKRANANAMLAEAKKRGIIN